MKKSIKIKLHIHFDTLFIYHKTYFSVFKALSL